MNLPGSIQSQISLGRINKSLLRYSTANLAYLRSFIPPLPRITLRSIVKIEILEPILKLAEKIQKEQLLI